jgi:putative NIF3 family GTP cyclohydrolase 1 type 2
MVIAHEPTFYDHLDAAECLADDPVVAAKRELIDELGLAVWRFHDHWHRHRPDGILTGMVRQLGWEGLQLPDSPFLFRLEPTTLAELAAYVKARTGARAVRVVGDPDMPCRTVAFAMGAPGARAHFRALADDRVDALIAGEGHEWEACEYARDATALGRTKGMIFAGHCNSEEAGMEYLVEWLGDVVPDVPAQFLPAGDPFWPVA